MRDHCCHTMSTNVQIVWDGGPPLIGDRPLLYDPVFDEYRLVSSDPHPGRVRITHCPWCGTPSPSSRREAWFDELAALGISPDDPQLPDAFRSDAWWQS
jgi:hypothetical protein